MVGADVRQAAHVHHLKMGRHKNVVEGPAQQRVVSVEGGHQAAAHARVEQARHAPEQLGRVRPGHVVHIAEHDGGLVAAVYLFAHEQQFRVALGAGFRFLRGRWLGMQPVEAHPGFAVGQLHVGVQRGNVIVEQVLYLIGLQGQAREKEQAIGVVEGLVAGIRVGCFEGAQLLVPPLVGFHGHDDVGVGFLQRGQGQRALSVVLQHVHHGQAELGVGVVGAGAIGHGLAHQRRVGHNARHLIRPRAGQQHQKTQLPRPTAGLAQREPGRQREHNAQHNLQARKVEHPNPPDGVAQQRQQRGHERQPANAPGEPAGRQQ